MAREIIGRSVWRALKQALVDSLPMAPRHHPAQQQNKIWSGALSQSSSSGSAAKAEMKMVGKKSSSLGRGCEEFVANRANSVRLHGETNYFEGLSSLLSPSCRPDATILQRSAAAVTRKCQLISTVGRRTAADHWKTPTAFPFGVRKVHQSTSTVGGLSSRTLLVKRPMEQSRIVTLTTASSSSAATRRNLSSGTTWTDRWNQLRKAVIGPKQQPKAKTTGAGGAATVGQKSGGQGPAILSEVIAPVRRTFAHYTDAVGLQIEAFWKRNWIVVVGLVGLGIIFLLWRLMFGIASTFISMSEGLAKFGFLALAAAVVIVGGVVLRARYIINPDAVYRLAMRKLNTSASVLEVLGAPLSGSDLRAYIMSGGGLRVKNFRPRLAGKRCFIIFPIHGADRRGLVSIEVKKKKGQYNFKLLAVDVPTAGADQRLYLIGEEAQYKIGAGLIHELRDPIIKAMAAQKELEELDIQEEEEDERKAVHAEQLRAREELEKMVKEEEEREQEDLRKSQEELDKLVREKLPVEDELEKPTEHTGKDSKPLRA